MKETKKNGGIAFITIVVIIYVILTVLFFTQRKWYTFLFENPLGSLFFLLFLAFIYFINKKMSLYVGFFVCLLYLMAKIIFIVQSRVEGFESNNGKWDPKLITQFDKFQTTYNPNLIFNMDEIQTQATSEEAQTLLDTGYWPWSQQVQDLFKENVQSNTIMKISPESALMEARTIYNEHIIKQMLSWKAPEGQILLTGVLVDNPNVAQDKMNDYYAIQSGLTGVNKDIIKCGTDKNNKSVLWRFHNGGHNGITEVHEVEKTVVDLNSLERTIPNFSFTKGVCNPCNALDTNYDCPFSLNEKKEISPIWKLLWGL
jgi:hypothetical protein